MRMRFGTPFHHDDMIGARVTVHLDHEDGAMAGIYHFGTHGLTPDEIVAERDRIVARHQAKTARFVAMDGLRSGTFKANEVTWSVSEAIITEQGSDWRLYAAATVGGDHVAITRICATMAEVPTNEQLLLALKEEAEALAAQATSAADHAAMLELLLGMGGEG